MTIYVLLLIFMLFANLFEEQAIEEQLIAEADFEQLYAMWGVEVSA